MVMNKHNKKRTKAKVTNVTKGIKGSDGLSGDVGAKILASDETDGNKIVQMIYGQPDPTSYDS